MSFLDKVLGRNSSHVSHKLKGRKRLPNETFEAYKKRRDEEDRLLSNYLQGDLVWCSKAFKRNTLTVDENGNPVYFFTVDKQKSKGTYVKKRDGIIKSPRRVGI